VFDAIVRNLKRLFGTRLAMVQIVKDGQVHLGAATEEEFETVATLFPRPLDDNFGGGRAIASKQVQHFVPVQGNATAPQATQRMAKELGFDAAIFAPMVRGDEVIGVIGTARRDPVPFDDKQIALIRAFADQAVIAIENTRLLNELRESLERQTATGEILASITGSISDTKPVFDAIVRNLQRLFGTRLAMVQIVRDGMVHLAATTTGEEFDAMAKLFPRPLDENFAAGRAMMSKQVTQFVPVQGNSAVPAATQQLAKALGFDAAIFAPMMRGDAVIGVVATARREPKPFDDKQITLIKAFAAQAVIAIENTRLLNELRARTEDLRQLNEQLERRVSDQVAEIERMGRLRRFLPPQVADLIVSSGAEKQLESHRREITALFCDLRGFTGFSESADPEDVMALLGEYHAAIGKVIFQHGGTLERFVGDGVMVIFNDPIPLENPSLHAVQMALDLRAAIGALIDTWRRMGHELGFGIGIAHGYATLGTIGFEGRYDYAAIGTVSNVASRLCDEARPGQILISPRVLTAVEGAVVVEPAGELVLKGIRRPLEVHNVVDMARRDR
jgi:class 3 adenylate cyclase